MKIRFLFLERPRGGSAGRVEIQPAPPQPRWQRNGTMGHAAFGRRKSTGNKCQSFGRRQKRDRQTGDLEPLTLDSTNRSPESHSQDRPKIKDGLAVFGQRYRPRSTNAQHLRGYPQAMWERSCHGIVKTCAPLPKRFSRRFWRPPAFQFERRNPAPTRHGFHRFSRTCRFSVHEQKQVRGSRGIPTP